MSIEQAFHFQGLGELYLLMLLQILYFAESELVD